MMMMNGVCMCVCVCVCQRSTVRWSVKGATSAVHVATRRTLGQSFRDMKWNTCHVAVRSTDVTCVTRDSWLSTHWMNIRGLVTSTTDRSLAPSVDSQPSVSVTYWLSAVKCRHKLVSLATVSSCLSVTLFVSNHFVDFLWLCDYVLMCV